MTLRQHVITASITFGVILSVAVYYILRYW